MITSTLIDVTSPTTKRVFTATEFGTPVVAPGDKRPTAITSIILCNKETPSLTNELTNDVDVSIYLVKDTQTPSATSNIIVSNLTIPAGETVFFSDERIILDGGDMIFVEVSDSNRLVVTVSSLHV